MSGINWEMEGAISSATARTYSLLEGSFNVDEVLWETLMRNNFLDERGLVMDELGLKGQPVNEYFEIRVLSLAKIAASAVDPQG